MKAGQALPFGHDTTVQLLTTLLSAPPPQDDAEEASGKPRPLLDHALVASITRARIALAGCVSKALTKARESPDAAQNEMIKVRSLYGASLCARSCACSQCSMLH